MLGVIVLSLSSSPKAIRPTHVYFDWMVRGYFGYVVAQGWAFNCDIPIKSTELVISDFPNYIIPETDSVGNSSPIDIVYFKRLDVVNAFISECSQVPNNNGIRIIISENNPVFRGYNKFQIKVTDTYGGVYLSNIVQVK